eukprot:Sdes_comp19346_c2_seq3m10573
MTEQEESLQYVSFEAGDRIVDDNGSSYSLTESEGSFSGIWGLQMVIRLYRRLVVWCIRRLADDWVFLTLLGLCSALVGFGMDYIIVKLYFFNKTLFDFSTFWIFQFILWVGFSLFLVSLSATLTHFVAPHASGSGIPEMKTIMR